MMFPWQKVNCRRGMVQDDTDLCACPVVVSTLKGGTFIFRRLQSNYVVMYIPLVPESAIVVSFG